LDIDVPLRTNVSFRLKSDEHYHKGLCSFEELSNDISSVVILEYMFNVCLGVITYKKAFTILKKLSITYLFG